MAGYGSGVETVVNYRYESDFTYGTYIWSDFTAGYDMTDKTFAGDIAISNLSVRRNLEKLYQYDKRYLWKAVPKQFEGMASFEFTLSNPWWLLGLFGDEYVTSATSNTVTREFRISNQAQSMSMKIGLRLLDADKIVEIHGCVITSATISSAVNELVKVRLDVLFKKMKTPYVGTFTGTDRVFDPYVFQHGSLEIPDGTDAGTVQRFELTINNNTVMQYGLGNQYAVRPIQKAFDITGRLTIAMTDTSYLTKVIGTNPTDATYSLLFSNGETGYALKSIEFKGTDVWYDEHTPTISKNEPIVEDLPLVFGQIKAETKDHYQTDTWILDDVI